MKKLLLATNNRDKIQEIKDILRPLNLEIVTLLDLPHVPAPIENGVTFEENALIKAQSVHRHTGLPSLADDSGLEVFYLNLKPGVLSARYAGDNVTYDQNNQKLLREMRGVPPRRRKARFRSVLALVGKGFEDLAEGSCLGRLAESPRGAGGFGYDPIFIYDDSGKTFGEMGPEEKNRISHRAKSLEKMMEILKKRLLS